MDNLHVIEARGKFFFEGTIKFFFKGVTYGPFHPNYPESPLTSYSGGGSLGAMDQVTRDLSAMQAVGINGIRVYTVPSPAFLDQCARFRIRVLVSIPWNQHVDFLSCKTLKKEVCSTIQRSVQLNAGHPALLGYLVGNEIPSPLVRWLGVQKVSAFLDHLLEIARHEDPRLLYSYANYPSSEYLSLKNIDFFTFNIFLHDRMPFERYLLRLQNLVGDHPLLLGECGLDTLRHSEENQAEWLRWQMESGIRGGLAGLVIYSWTDEWFRGGCDIQDWAFGLTTRARQPKLALSVVRQVFQREAVLSDALLTATLSIPAFPREAWAVDPFPTVQFPLKIEPQVSIIVCSYNGAKTLERCLRSLEGLNYLHYEMLLVDDGSTDHTSDIASRHPKVRYIFQEHQGLSVARNVGAQAAKGDILAYLDSDCIADADWLYFLIQTLLDSDACGVGGPNIPPPAKSWVQAGIAAAPGGPCHVLLTDQVAEHIPGCNMAFYKWAWELIGGFDPEYQCAGDDVDFCWRLQQQGERIAFSPAAMVWHYRRLTFGAFFKQQYGYGEAEALLRFKHLGAFGRTGLTHWKGRIYGSSAEVGFFPRQLIYHGRWGLGLFQALYPPLQSEWGVLVSSIEWHGLILLGWILVFMGKIPIFVPFLLLLFTFWGVLMHLQHTRLDPRYEIWKTRLGLAFLIWTQPLVRGWARHYTWLRYKRTPRRVVKGEWRSRKEFWRNLWGTWKGPKSTLQLHQGKYLQFWSLEGLGRKSLLPAFIELLQQEGWSYSLDAGWRSWDVQVYGSFWWAIRIKSVTEDHGQGQKLTRVKLSTRFLATTLVTQGVLFLLILCILCSPNNWHEVLLGVAGGDLFFFFFLWSRLWSLKKRVAEVLQRGAKRVGLQIMGHHQKLQGEKGEPS